MSERNSSTIRLQVAQNRNTLRNILEAFVLSISTVIYSNHIPFWPLPVQAIFFAAIFGLALSHESFQQRLALGLFGFSVAIPLLFYWPSSAVLWTILILMVTVVPVIRKDHRGDFTALLIILAGPMLVALRLGFIVPLVAGLWFGRSRGARIAFSAGLLVLASGVILAQPLLGGVFITGSSGATPASELRLTIDPSFSWFREMIDELPQKSITVLDAPLHLWQSQIESHMIGFLQVSIWSIAAYVTGWALNLTTRWAYVQGWGSLLLGQTIVLVIQSSVGGIRFPVSALVTNILISIIIFYLTVEIAKVLLDDNTFKETTCHRSVQEFYQVYNHSLDDVFGLLTRHRGVIQRTFVGIVIGWLAWRATAAFGYFELSYRLSIIASVAILSFTSLKLGLIVTITMLSLLAFTQSILWGILTAVFGLLLSFLLLLIAPKNSGKYVVLCVFIIALLPSFYFVPLVILAYTLITSDQKREPSFTRGPISVGLIFISCWLMALAVNATGHESFEAFIWDGYDAALVSIEVPAEEQRYKLEEVVEIVQGSQEETTELLEELSKAFLGTPLLQLLLWSIVSAASVYVYRGLVNSSHSSGVSAALTIFLGSLLFCFGYLTAKTFWNINLDLGVSSIVKYSLVNAILGSITLRFCNYSSLQPTRTEVGSKGVE